MAPLLRNALPEDALRHARPQIQDLSTESIADLAVRARELGGVIPLWYGEADLTEYQTKLHGRPIGQDRSTVTPSGMQSLLVAMELVADVGTNVVYVEPQ